MDITPYMNRLDILSETARQLTKDFGITGFEATFSGNSDEAYRELFSQVLPLVEKLQKENFQKFYDLMYRIDISEGEVKRAVESASDKKISEIVTDLILKRELIKVIFRTQYSK